MRLMGDCSAQVTAAEGGAASGVQRYSAFGEVRSRGGEMPTVYQYTGQLSQMEEVGLYHYGARWFDPAGAHFTQADTLIPELYNPLDVDRYAYGRGNPLKYTDPTGHMVACEYGDECEHLAPSTKTVLTANYYVEYLKAQGITLSGEIFVEDARTFFTAFQKINGALHWKFAEFVGPVTINFKYITTGKYGGEWQGNKTINFWGTNAGQLPEINIFHEFGHLIEQDVLRGKPGAELESNSFYDSYGNFVMGLRNGSYDRQTCWGYNSGCNVNNPWNFEQHPRSWEPDGNTGGEEFADMFLNYVAGSIDMMSGPGLTRFNFMTKWLP
ncbi:protein containing RHS repeat-associated core domain [Levilinea saccharolytica]|nr:protein containing RHS repeat-associated core domain [Levilinea saccharolytica]